jgi:hypothetical protein
MTEVDTYLSSDKGIFFVNYMHLNPKANLSADDALRTAQEGLLQIGPVKSLTSTRTEFVRGPNDRLPMLEFTGETDASAMKGSLIFDTDHIYTLATLCPKGQDCSAAVTKFLTSFKLNPTKQPTETWINFNSTEGKFSALFPVAPNPTHQTVNPEGQTIQVNNVVVKDNDMLMGVTYTDYDPATTYSIESGMKAEQDALLKGLNVTVLTSTRTEFPRGSTEKLPSLEFTAASNEQSLKAIVIVDDHRVYIVAFICPKTKNCSSETQKFFSSFHLTAKD